MEYNNACRETDVGKLERAEATFLFMGSILYKGYKIGDINRPYAVQLNAWKGTVAEVYVNDVKAGIIAFDPYRLGITSLLKQGKNIIEVRVIGSHKNLLVRITIILHQDLLLLGIGKISNSRYQEMNIKCASMV